MANELGKYSGVEPEDPSTGLVFSSQNKDSSSNQELSQQEIRQALLSITDQVKEVKKLKTQLLETETELNKKIKETTESINKMKDDTTKDFDQKINESKFKVIELLGIFVALFTFVSSDFKIFQSAPDNALALVLTTAGILLAFIFAMDLFLNPNTNEIGKKTKILAAVSCSLVVIGLILFASHSASTTKQAATSNNLPLNTESFNFRGIRFFQQQGK